MSGDGFNGNGSADEGRVIQRVVIVGSQLGLVDQSDTYLAQAFRQVGCQVRAFDYRATTFIPRWLSRLAPAGVRRLSPRRIPGVEQADASFSNRRFDSLVARYRPELVMALQAERLHPVAIQRARDAGAVTMNWMHDEPAGRVDPEVVPLYDLWMVWDASTGAWLRRYGARRVEHLPVACDSAHHHPVALSPAARRRWASDLCFVGGYQEGRESLLAAVADLGLVIWGPGWQQASDPAVRARVRAATALHREEWLKAYAATKIVINIHSQGTEGLNLRVWEALAASTCLVSDYRSDIDRFLSGVVATFTNREELRRRCQELLQDEPRRKMMAQQGRERVVNHHTFRHRAEQILAWAEELRRR